MRNYYVYILLCIDGSNYTGITSDIRRRLAEHEAGTILRCYTNTRRPVELKYCEWFGRPLQAIFREKQIKGWSRAKKEALINNKPELLPALAKRHASTSSA
jgi:putative endonuclease